MRFLQSAVLCAVLPLQVFANDTAPDVQLSAYEKVDAYWYGFDSDAQIQLIATGVATDHMGTCATCAAAELAVLNGLRSFAPVGAREESYDSSLAVAMTFILSEKAGTGITRLDGQERLTWCAAEKIAEIL